MPNAGQLPPVAGDDFVRSTDEAQKSRDMQFFTWAQTARGLTDVNPIATPSQAAQLYHELKEEKAKEKETQMSTVLEKYGGAEHLVVPPKELLLDQSEVFVEYSRTGKLLRGDVKPVQRSRYEEDGIAFVQDRPSRTNVFVRILVFINDHKAVFGSYWKDFKWGYACCHQFLRNSYCTGEAGKQAASSSANVIAERMSTKASAESLDGRQGAHPSSTDRTELSSSRGSSSIADRKRHGLDASELQEAELESYRKKRYLAEDPMFGSSHRGDD